jgi:hypothetical protein
LIAYPLKTPRGGPHKEELYDKRRLWFKPTDVIKDLLEKPPTEDAFQKKKADCAFRVAAKIRVSSWVEENQHAVAGLKKIVEELCKNTNS